MKGYVLSGKPAGSSDWIVLGIEKSIKEAKEKAKDNNADMEIEWMDESVSWFDKKIRETFSKVQHFNNGTSRGRSFSTFRITACPE